VARRRHSLGSLSQTSHSGVGPREGRRYRRRERPTSKLLRKKFPHTKWTDRILQLIDNKLCGAWKVKPTVLQIGNI